MPRQKFSYAEARRRANAADKVRRAKKIELIQRFKRMKGCSECSARPSDLGDLHFHHVDPSTKKHKGNAINYGWSMPRLKEELSKCVVLCKGCHLVKPRGAYKKILVPRKGRTDEED